MSLPPGMTLVSGRLLCVSGGNLAYTQSLRIHRRMYCVAGNLEEPTRTYKELTHWQRPLMPERLEGRGRRGVTEEEMVDGNTNSKDMSLGGLQEDREGQGSLSAIVREVPKSQMQLSHRATMRATI